jgi:hypothetical protein
MESAKMAVHRNSSRRHFAEDAGLAFGGLRQGHGRAGAVLAVAPMNPARGKTLLVRAGDRLSPPGRGMGRRRKLDRLRRLWPAFADSASSLRYLKRHYKLAILSNVDNESFSFSNEKLGVDFDAIYTAEDCGFYKPSARNFEYMLRKLKTLGIEKNQILHTAESLFHDHATAWPHNLNQRRSLRPDRGDAARGIEGPCNRERHSGQ